MTEEMRGECGIRLKKALRSNALKNIGVYLANVFHDDWCASFKQEPCDCDPLIEIMATETKEVLTIGKEGEIVARKKSH